MSKADVIGGFDPSGVTVLIVDDIEPNRDLLQRRLSRLGFTSVIQAADGREALGKLQSQRVDLMLLDIMMPVMNGYEVLEAMKREGTLAGTPTIVVSALSDIASVVRAIELGAEDFLFKPFEPTLLRARVLATLEKKLLRDRMTQELARQRSELAEARQLQLSLKPSAYSDPALQIDVTLEPALEVGGDLVDHFRLPDGRHVFALGDVSGKGAGAALMMARTHAMLRGLTRREDAGRLFDDPAHAVGIINRELSANNATCIFVTFVLAVLDASAGRLTYVRCGHVEPFIGRTNGQVERLTGPRQLPLGLDEDFAFESTAVPVTGGDRLLILSDGVTEATDTLGEVYGEDRVTQWLCGPDASLEQLLAEVRAFEAGSPPSDDISCLLVRFGHDVVDTAPQV